MDSTPNHNFTLDPNDISKTVNNGLHNCLLNASSLVNKLTKFQAFVYSSNYSILCITETWLSSDICDNEILRNDRDSRGGGVLIAIRDSITSSIIPSPSNIEVISVLISMQTSFIICVLYYEILFNYLIDLVNGNTNPVILLGDFNFPDVDWCTLSGSSSKSNKFCDLLFQLNLTQLVDKPTHNLGNILDLIITNNEDIIYDLIIHPQNYKPISTDHFLISFTILVPTEHTILSPTQVIFDYSKANYHGLTCFLSDIDFPFVNIYQILTLFGFLSRIVLLEQCTYLHLKSH